MLWSEKAVDSAAVLGELRDRRITAFNGLDTLSCTLWAFGDLP